MQVEQQHRPSTSAWDIADILHSDLFTAPAPLNPNPSPSTSFSSPSSRESTPMSHHLPTPPQQPPYPTFPASAATASNPMDLSSDSFFSFLEGGDVEGKGIAGHGATHTDPFATSGSNSFDYNFGFDFASMPMMMTSPMPAGGPQSASEYGMDMNAYMSGLGVDATMEMGIDPQLVDSPAPLVTMDEDEAQPDEEVEQEEQDVDEAPIINTRSSNKKKDAPTESIASTRTKRGRKSTTSANTQSRASSSSPTATSPSTTTQQDSQQSDKLTLTIAPVKVGGRGGARRGTVQSGGITKKSATPVTGANGPIYSGSLLKVVKEDAGKENNVNAATASKGRGRGRRGTTAAAAPAALPSPPSSHHDGEDFEEETSPGALGKSSVSSLF